MNRFTYIAITWVAYAAMLVVNTLANSLPLNGYTTGQLSGFYPNLFVPDGFTFSIWGIIYLWLLVFTGYATKVLVWLPAIDKRVARIKAVLPIFWITCLWNALWIVAWHWLQPGLSLLIMVLLLATLVVQYATLLRHRAAPRRQDHLLVEVPFIIYFGWISVAIIANTTALLVSMGWQGGGLSETTWAILLIIVATLAGVYMSFVHHRPAYTLVIAWALLGIFRAQNEGVMPVAYAAIAGLAVCIGFALRELMQPQRGWKMENL